MPLRLRAKSPPVSAYPERLHIATWSKWIIGFEDKDGMTKITCEDCGVTMVRKTMGRRHDRIDIYAPRTFHRKALLPEKPLSM